MGDSMKKNFFDLVPEGFFNVFSGNNKRINYDLLQILNTNMSLDNLNVYREDIMEWFLDYINTHNLQMIDEKIVDPRDYASDKIRYFVNYGWLSEDIDGLKITYQLDENGIELLKTMDDLTENENKPLEFSGFVYNIYQSFKNFDVSKSVMIVEQINESSEKLNAMLRGLNINIKKFLNKLIRETEATPKDILDAILCDYQNKVVLKAFKNFREKENPSKYKNEILDKIDVLMEPLYFDEMVKNYIDRKLDGNVSNQNKEIATNYFETTFNKVKDQFESIEDNIDALNDKNTKYVSSAKARLSFLLNEEKNVEGKINDILKGFANVTEEFFENSYIRLYEAGNLDDKSLYTAKAKAVKPEEPSLVLEEMEDILFVEEYKNRIFRDNDFSLKKINEYALNCLGKYNSILASSIFITSFEEIMKLFLVQLYSQNNDVDYNVTFIDEKYFIMLDNHRYRLMDFKLERREK